MSYGYRIFRRDPIPTGAAQSATYSQLASGSGFEWPHSARNAAAKAAAAAEVGYDTAGPDLKNGIVYDVFEE
jgi:hypothetical protein